MILGLDTATERLHLALVDGDQAWTRWLPGGPGRSASLTLLPAVDELLAEAGRGRRDLSGVCACVGPGGFTSLRIGVATAEGLALTGLPTWGFSAFRLRAEALGRPAWILLDGQRSETFAQRWEGGPTSEAAKVPFPELRDLVGGAPWWAPVSVLPKLQPHLDTPPLALEAEPEATLGGLVRLCRELPAGEPEVPLHPFYLRETDAELNFPHMSAHLPEALRRGLAR